MDVLATIKTLLSGSDVFTSVGNVIDKFVTTDAEKEAANQALLEIKNAQLIKESQQIAELEAIYNADTASAREMQNRASESANASWLSKNIAPLIAIASILLTFSLFIFIVFFDVPAEKKDIVIYILGVLSSIVLLILGFYFGSTHGGQKKTEALINQAANKQ